MVNHLWLAIGLSVVACAAGCGSSYNGEDCDLGTGDITQQLCDQAAAASTCATHRIEQHPTANPCPGGPEVTETCCDYTGCSGLPSFPQPTPSCT